MHKHQLMQLQSPRKLSSGKGKFWGPGCWSDAHRCNSRADKNATGLTNKILKAYVRGTITNYKRGRNVAMAYKHTNAKGVTYYLNSKEVTLRGGKQQRIYYFSKDERPEACDLPDGFEVNENNRNGFLTVKRKK